jgi:hypothetical protein
MTDWDMAPCNLIEVDVSDVRNVTITFIVSNSSRLPKLGLSVPCLTKQMPGYKWKKGYGPQPPIMEALSQNNPCPQIARGLQSKRSHPTGFNFQPVAIAHTLNQKFSKCGARLPGWGESSLYEGYIYFELNMVTK